MNAYLFGFGYEDPDDLRSNRETGDDAECSTGVFIHAPDAQAAVAWGSKIAEAFMKYVHGDPAISWIALGYASWIEDDPGQCDWSHCLDFLPHVSVGQMPDLQSLTSEAYAQWLEGKGRSANDDV